MNSSLRTLLVCPTCRGALAAGETELRCANCRRQFPIVRGVPIFLPEGAEVVMMPAGHSSNPIGPEFEEILARGDGLVLHLGAGSTATRYPHCIEFEHRIFRHTDIVGDAHALPFREASFDRVMAFNVFEHLRAPARAATEILRVLKPGVSLDIHTAFLQPLHEEPRHYYNATEYGVREWFGDFQIEKCEVSANFSPGVMLGFLTASLLEVLRQSAMPATMQSRIAETQLGQWADFWNRKSDPPPGFAALVALPQELQKRVSAGFELRARKPAVS